MAGSASGQDKANPGYPSEKDGPILPARDCRFVPSKAKLFGVFFWCNPLLTKFVWSRWLDIGLVIFSAFLWTSTPSRSIKTPKQKLANIQPS